MKLLLFDIDGTLLHSGGAGRRAMDRAFEEVYRIPDGFHGIEMAGKTDTVILQEALRKHGISERQEEVEAFKQRYFELLRDEIRAHSLRQRVMPGIRRLLDRLSKHPEVTLGLLTGNWRESGLIKLRHFGLADYFKLGAFAEDAPSRDELVPVAVERFRQLTGKTPKAEDVWVIGDTPRDVACARPHSARAIAVATGNFSLEELAAAKPDALFPDFSDLETFLMLLEESPPAAE
jgi:phosphoglycolate phosphatase-like HAD superfamily hydrolase